MNITLRRLHRRFIPAGAGNTTLLQGRSRCIPVYPRWRGEHLDKPARFQGVGGLSPLARGTPLRPKDWLSVFRFIPAGAGNTYPQQPCPLLLSVYPRWRGEHTALKTDNAFISGLSPLARGTRSKMQSLMHIAPVYPRWRGEHLCGAYRENQGGGLSPLARGTLIKKVSAMSNVRFIPAGAGNTLTISYCFIINLSAKNNLPTFLQQIDVFKEP